MKISEVWVEGYCIDDEGMGIADHAAMGKHAQQSGSCPLCEAGYGFDDSFDVADDDGCDDEFDDEEFGLESCGLSDGEKYGKKSQPMSKGKKNKELGRRGEAAAARYLEHIGYEIVERNWECKYGEADIVAYDEETLVFVEVKTRTSIKKGFPSEAVTPEKRHRYEQIAACYLADCHECDFPVRFDVIGLLVVSPDRAMIKHTVNAFGWEK